MPKSRDWPLTEAEQDLVVKAYEISLPIMRVIRRRNRRYADDIESEFNRKICQTIHKFDAREMSFETWVGATIKYSATQVMSMRQPGQRCLRSRGIHFEPITNVADGLVSREPTPDQAVERQESIERTAKAIRVLTPREQEILRLHYGLDGVDVLSVQCIGIRFSIRRERVWEIKQIALAKLRRILKSEV